jgi:selenocysteine lyase/cysteine desulfurase
VIPSLKTHFSRALSGGAGRVHLAAHSHHLWPDVTFVAHMQAWEDAARLWDGKWSHVFGEVLPEAQRHVAGHLGLADPGSIAFAPNTHEFVLRLFSALPADIVPRVLTTDSEFHSFSRQAARLAEDGMIELDIVKVAPFESFAARFTAAATAQPHDLVFFSQVFFNSGFVVPDLAAVVAGVAEPDTLVVIDGYHAFMALPVDLSAVQHRVFYLGGGYKYACAGEGVCFMACPDGYAPRPRDTGWYAAFGALAEAGTTGVAYAEDGGRFMGATFDPSGLYRLNASMRWLAGQGVDAAAVHARALAMQAGFVASMDAAGIAGLTGDALIVPARVPDRGNFLAYRSPWAAAQQARLEAAGIVTDVRGDVLRIGFGLYHDPADVPAIAARVRAALAGAGSSPGSGTSP